MSRTAIADGMACRKPDAAALEIMKAGMDRVVMVDDEEVKDAMRAYFADTHNVAEGAGAAGLGRAAERPWTGGASVGR